MDELKNLNRTLGFYFFFKPKKPKFGLFRFFRFFLKPKNLGFLKPYQTVLVHNTGRATKCVNRHCLEPVVSRFHWTRLRRCMTSMTDDGIAFQVLGLIVAGVYETRIHHKLRCSISRNTNSGAVVQLVEYRTRNQEVAGSTHTQSTASNLEQVANPLCAQANSASYPQLDGK